MAFQQLLAQTFVAEERQVVVNDRLVALYERMHTATGWYINSFAPLGMTRDALDGRRRPEACIVHAAKG